MTTAGAVEVAFTVDPARSSIALSGLIPFPPAGSFTLHQQGPGSLNASYAGTIIAGLSPDRIEFSGGSTVRANNSGIWRPATGGGAGSDPANYGGEITPPLTTGYAAGRNICVDLSSPPIPLAKGSFDASLLVVSFQTNNASPPSFDFRVSSLIPALNTNGTVPLIGSATNGASSAYLTNDAGALTLILPVNTTNSTTIGGNPATLVLRGQIVATAPPGTGSRLVGIEIRDDQATLAWPSLLGDDFLVETTEDLTTPWMVVTGAVSTEDNTTLWTAVADGSTRFYRVAWKNTP